MIKRYRVDPPMDGWPLEFEQDQEDGPWVRWEDVKGLVEAAREAAHYQGYHEPKDDHFG